MDAKVRDGLGEISPRVLAQAEELERDLPPALFAEVVALLARVEEDVSDRVYAEARDHEKQVIDGLAAHFPGLAGALRAVALHVGDRWETCATRDKPDGCGVSWAATLLANPGP